MKHINSNTYYYEKTIFICIICNDDLQLFGQRDKDNPNPDPTVTLTEIELSTNILEFDITGGEKSIYVYLNYDGYSNKEPNDQWQLTGGESWCKPSITRGNNGDEVTFSVDGYSENRTTVFTIACGNIKAELTIIQTGYTSVNVEQAGTLNSVLSKFDATSIKMLRITGNLNDEDFLAIRNLPNLEYLDISELPLLHCLQKHLLICMILRESSCQVP